MSTKKFDYESLQDADSIKTYLVSLTDSIEKGRIILKSNGEKMVMRVDDLMKFSVQAKKKDGINKLSIKLSWSEIKPVIKDQRSSTMSIES
ncbi:amphi-Trp domain-containing protein [Thiovibrio frasassiensis]|uniref:Amphi-Trp domain-containing protein n=1 Tax=Thiovibrio frasassiensis TaxID=2984131 RepID=A0A9X4MGH4_9BACT|nr:amphi-Trp domain-containing protein [Thiovibrio frasassiensis]MDG4476187.1 amphi-Trp domain-containing protein [Thiovibrio frasassiensis]